MVRLHRLGHQPEPFHVNAGLVVLVEAAPDTHVTLATGQKLIVSETVDEVVAALDAWHASVASRALRAMPVVSR